MSKRRFPLNKFPKLLKNPPPDIDIMLYDKKEKRVTHSRDNIMNKPTLNQRIDQLNLTVEKLAIEMRNGFNELRQDIKNINARLDYIVEANNLKDKRNV